MNWKMLTRLSFRQISNLVRMKVAGCIRTECDTDPVELAAFITTRCNLRCNTCPFTHCSPYSPVAGVPDLTPKLLELILNAYPGAMSLGIVGGEPLLHPDLLDLIRIGQRRKLIVNLSTNGLLLDEEYATKLLDSHLGFLNISLDSANAQEYKRMRGGDPDLYRRILHNAGRFGNLRNQRNSPIRFMISHVTDSRNIRQIPDFARLAAEIGADAIFCQSILPYNCSDLTSQDSILWDNPETRKVLNSIVKPHNIQVILPILVPGNSQNRTVQCVHPCRLMSFDGGGNLSPCCVIPPHPKFGNLKENMQIWRRGGPLSRLRAEMIQGSEASLDVCLGCWEKFSLQKLRKI